MTLREIINKYRNEIKEDLQPHRASEILVELSSLQGNINDEIRKRDMEYNVKLRDCYKAESKANRAKIEAEISPEYENMRKTKDIGREVTDMIRSLKYYLRVKEDELRNAHNQ